MIKLKGIAVSGGVGIGKALVLKNTELSVPKRKITHDEISREIYRLEEALIETRKEISDLQKKISSELGFDHGRIFEEGSHDSLMEKGGRYFRLQSLRNGTSWR